MTVLLVEDDAMVRLTLADFFEDAGIDFLEAGSAEEALALLDDTSQRIDVLVTDLNLGAGDNGLALAIKARQIRPGLPVIYETGSQDILANRTLFPWEQVFYKPFDPAALATTVSALNRSRGPRHRHQRLAASKTLASSL